MPEPDRVARLTQGPVGRTIFRLALPMVGGIFAIVGFNLADTYFVARLGTLELAAMSFTFPVVWILYGIAMGLGTGTTSTVSRAIGAGNQSAVRRLASDSLSLAFLLVLASAAVGMLTIQPVFRLLGADPDLIPLIRDYMIIWYPGVAFLVIPMVANAAIRATGDTKVPALIMVCATGLNVILDPILIFGLLGFPALGLKGAALATVIARGTTMVASLLVLHYRERMLDFRTPSLKDVFDSWRQVLTISIPATITNLLQPIGLGIVTRMIARYSDAAVAAWGAGSRISGFALIPVFGLCSALVPFVGQNWGAEAYGRVRQVRKYAYHFASLWGVLMLVLLYFLGAPVASLFSSDPDVVAEIVRYLKIIPLGFVLVGILSVTEETLNAIGKPLIATLQTVIHMFVFYVPLALLGAAHFQLTGLLGGLASADIIGGLVGIALVRSLCGRKEREEVVEQAA